MRVTEKRVDEIVAELNQLGDSAWDHLDQFAEFDDDAYDDDYEMSDSVLLIDGTDIQQGKDGVWYVAQYGTGRGAHPDDNEL